MRTAVLKQLLKLAPADSRSLFEPRLDNWRASFNGREIPPSQGIVEVDLVQAVIRLKRRNGTALDMEHAHANCLSDACKAQIH